MDCATLRRKLRTAPGLPLREKLWVVILIPLSFFIYLSLHKTHFKFFSRFLGRRYENYPLSTIVGVHKEIPARGIEKTIEPVSRNTPWETKCLVQVCMAKVLLFCYRIPCVIHLGAYLTDDNGKPLKAHALKSRPQQ